ncbi:hypothetical protein GCM10017597_03000 [Brachybacterium conglomeratum]|nr:hypothetical protein GCM10017597_03000 [Brachybacterium conglomeratum]
MFMNSSAASVAVTMSVHSSANGIELPPVFGVETTVRRGREVWAVRAPRAGRIAGA